MLKVPDFKSCQNQRSEMLSPTAGGGISKYYGLSDNIEIIMDFKSKHSELTCNPQQNDCHALNGTRVYGTPKQFPLFIVQAWMRDHLQASPLEKMISSDRLSFIPNLYYQQYRLLDVLGENRIDYPEQKILVPRKETRHDHLMQQMRKNRFILEEELKYRKAVCFNLAKNAKQEFFKKKLKKEEKYLFHRVAYSQLAEAVRSKLEENKNQLSPNDKKLENDKQKSVKQKAQDDIFLDKQESEHNINGDGGDLLDGLFDNPKVEVVQEKPEEPKLPSIEDYLLKLYEFDDRSKECKKILNRKACFKKINENIRKRIKSKLNEDAGEKNLNSATVLITSLISGQSDSKASEIEADSLLIETPAETQFLSCVETKPKRKKEQHFELKWNKETMEEFQAKNSKFDLFKSKFEANYLTTAISQKEYEKVFSKNISSKEPFPPSFNNIPSLDSQFKVNPYYNTQSDRDYQKFVMKYNKKNQFQKFKQISSYALQDTYNDGETSSIAKIFLNPEGISDRVIYQVNNNKLVPVNTVHKETNLSKEQLLILSFLIRKYLSIFGSNWKIITMLILTHPIFSNMLLNTEQIQQLYQMTKDKASDCLIEQIDTMNKRMLPSSIFVNSTYHEMQAEDKLEPIYEEMTDENEEIQPKEVEQLDLDNYEALINEPLEQQEEVQPYAFEKTSRQYEKYVESARLITLNDYPPNLTEHLGAIIGQFQGKSEVKLVEAKEPSKFSQSSEWVLEKVRNQIKFNTPIRKRKNITDKSSELVKILHLLKQKLQPTKPPPSSAMQGRPPVATTPAEPTKQAATPAPSTAPAPQQPPVQAPNSNARKILPKSKTQDKPKAVSQTKEPKRKKGGKDGERDAQ